MVRSYFQISLAFVLRKPSSIRAQASPGYMNRIGSFTGYPEMAGRAIRPPETAAFRPSSSDPLAQANYQMMDACEAGEVSYACAEAAAAEDQASLARTIRAGRACTELFLLFFSVAVTIPVLRSS